MLIRKKKKKTSDVSEFASPLKRKKALSCLSVDVLCVSGSIASNSVGQTLCL